jgi:two-component system response regulator NreC
MPSKTVKQDNADPITAREELSVLTTREQEVCKLLAYGHTNAEIAQRLLISERTVETHRANILSKLSLKKRSELVRFAIKNKLLTKSFD